MYTKKPIRKKTKRNFSEATGSTWSKPTVFRGVVYRSTWEVVVAKLLLYADLDSSYEPRRFILGPKLTYLPDFYLPDMKCYIEVKGWLKEIDKVKIEAFKSKVTKRLVYLGKEELEYITGLSGAKISKIDLDKYIPSYTEIQKLKQIIYRTLRGTK